MKQILPFLLLVLTANFSHAQSDAGAYLQIIGEQYSSISHEMMSYASAVNHGKSARKIEKRRQDFMLQIKESETIVRRLKPFNGKTTLRDSIAAYFKISRIILNEDYGKILDMEDIAEQSYDAMEAYLLAKQKASEKGDIAQQAAKRQYETFAAENNITLRESESDLGAKVKKTAEVTDYSNKLYLLFFKSYKNEVYLMSAMSKDDMISIEQSRNALASSANEDLGKAQSQTPFNGDGTLRAALIQSLNFYKIEAEEKVTAYTQFLLAKDNMDKIKKSYDSKGKKTQEDVNQFNASVNEFNARVNAANAMTQDQNKKRNAALKVWNEAHSSFLDKHTPKHR
jgi:hypothetical protein